MSSIKRLLFAVAILICITTQLNADKIVPSTILPHEGAPEHLYTMISGNNIYANGRTAPTQIEENYGRFAFYEVSGKSGAYYIYSQTEGKWLSFTTASGSYSNMKGFVQLSQSRNDNAYFKLNNYQDDFYEISPYTTSGTTDKYLNWYQGVGENTNPYDGSYTLGLWEDNGAKDGGSRWIFNEQIVVEHIYTINAPEGCMITIGDSNYTNGDQYTCNGSVTRGEIGVTAPEGQFAIVVIDDTEATITVSFVEKPDQSACVPYTYAVVYPKQQEAVGVANTQLENGVYTLSNNVLAASFVKVSNTLFFAGSDAMNLLPGTELFSVAFGNGDNVYASAMNLKSVGWETLQADSEAIGGVEHFAGKQLVAEYDYIYNGTKINIIWRAVLRDGSHYLRTEMELTGADDVDMYNVIPLIYHVDTEAAGAVPAVVGNTRGAVLMSNKIFAGLENPVAYNTVGDVVSGVVSIQGRWSRNTTLAQGETWKIAGVVGLIAQDGTEADANIHKTQKRRSFLAYSERERAVPWRANPVYITWYELNIDRNNAPNPVNNMNANQVLDVLQHWKTDFYDVYGVAPNSFVLDDGWDNYGPWTFHAGFPRELRDIAALAAQMDGAGVGAWLGPVGGYGQSGDYRRNYWKNQGGMQLSNPAYYQVFLDAAENLTQNQGNFNFFKFDGISAQATAYGPDSGDQGNENAEGIIRLEQYVRENLRPDIFFNTTVGTWASPFWYQITDATWRQDADYSECAGSNTIDRERWITYRDKQVYQIYVSASPICPINTLMTHGFILSSHGEVSKNMDYEPARRELRCAFVCGSGMVELYNDYALMNSINNGALWGDLAECIEWQRRNADVLPDIHWVGGNPWNGSASNIYGWASWNGEKSTLALRNGSNSTKTYTFTLREALNIPAHVTGSIRLSKSFEVQDALQGLTEGVAINIDTPLTVTLPGCGLFCFDGVTDNTSATESYKVEFGTAENGTFEIQKANGEAIVSGDELPVGTSLTVVTTPEEGYELNAILVNGVALTGHVFFVGGVTMVEVTFKKHSVKYCGTDWGNSTHASRALESLTVKGGTDGNVQISGFETTPTHAIYSDLSDQVVNVDAGSTLSIKANSAKEVVWTHGYIYIDYNNDGEFTVDLNTENGLLNPGSELVSYSYYGVNDDTEKWGYDSEGNLHNTEGSCNRGASLLDEGRIPAFTLPTNLANGQYRIRFKADWNSINPCGNGDTNNLITNNGGYIIDFTLNVNNGAGIGDVEEKGVVLYYANGQIFTNVEEAIAIYDMTGNLVKHSAATPVPVEDLVSGVYIVSVNGKTLKFVK